jgi:oligoendopeptidase F
LRSKAHILDGEGEKLLALADDLAQTPYQVFSMFNNADISFPKIKDEKNKSVELTKGNFSLYIRSDNRDVRKRAYQSMYGVYQKWKNTLAANLAGAVKSNIYFARARKYSTAMEAALDTDNIPLSVYENVVRTLRKNVAPMHQYIKLRKKILKLDKIRP